MQTKDINIWSSKNIRKSSQPNDSLQQKRKNDDYENEKLICGWSNVKAKSENGGNRSIYIRKR